MNYEKLAEQQLLKLANNNSDPKAFFELGQRYLGSASEMKSKEDIDECYATAFDYYEKAADNGDSAGYMMMGLLLGLGFGVEQNDRSAKAYLMLAKEGGIDVDEYIEALKEGRLSEMFDDSANEESEEEDSLEEKKDDPGKTDYNNLSEDDLERLYKKNRDISALQKLVTAYKDGDTPGIKQSDRKMSKWLERGVDANDRWSIEWMAYLYRMGEHGFKKDIDRAISYYEKGLTAGSKYCAEELEKLLTKGTLVKKDINRAIRVCDRGISLGSSECATDAGRLYFWGMGVQMDIDKALQYYKDAARLGSGYAMYQIGQCYERKKWWLDAANAYKDAIKKEYWPACARFIKLAFYDKYQMPPGIRDLLNDTIASAIKHKDGDSLKIMAEIMIAGQSYEDAEYYLKLGMENGNADCRALYGDYLINQKGDLNEGLRQLEEAKAQESYWAYYYLGDYYLINREDAVTAFPLLEKAAQKTIPPAMLKTGICLGFGQGTKENPASSKYWLKLADEFGEEMATEVLKNL